MLGIAGRANDNLAVLSPLNHPTALLWCSVANGDVAKAAAVTDAVARELGCMKKDVGSINLYCSDCERKSESSLPRAGPASHKAPFLSCGSTSVDVP